MDFEELIRQADATPFEGWDFGVFAGRFYEGRASWDYRAVVEARLASAIDLLDLGTGGGELLSRLTPLPQRVVATESYPPNVPVARRRLEPLGIDVMAVDQDEAAPLPFADRRFSLITNRHEAFRADEIHRVLRPGGLFISQQVGGRDLGELNRALDAPGHTYARWNLNAAVRALSDAGLKVLQCREELINGRFADVGAVALYLRVSPWQISDYDPARYRSRLAALHKRMETEGPLRVRHHRFLVVAKRPA
jgi:SAM-dependent methyltransferase